VTGLLRLEGRNAAARTAALARLALVPVLVAFEALDAERAAPDLWFVDALLYAFIAYAIAGAVYAFAVRADVPLAPFAILDIAVIALFTCAEGGATSDVRYMLFVPVLVAVLTGPRLTLGLSVLSVAAFIAAAVANPYFDL
jgi:hypothetical protein